jgi:hypothetical protein
LFLLFYFGRNVVSTHLYWNWNGTQTNGSKIFPTKNLPFNAMLPSAGLLRNVWYEDRLIICCVLVQELTVKPEVASGSATRLPLSFAVSSWSYLHDPCQDLWSMATLERTLCTKLSWWKDSVIFVCNIFYKIWIYCNNAKLNKTWISSFGFKYATDNRCKMIRMGRCYSRFYRYRWSRKWGAETLLSPTFIM